MRRHARERNRLAIRNFRQRPRLNNRQQIAFDLQHLITANYSTPQVPFMKKTHQIHNVLAISTKSLKIPYAVCSTPGLNSTVPTLPISSVSSTRMFDVPRTLARI